VVHYRDVHEVDLAGGRIQDIGLALVLQGQFASAAEVIDLGSADVKTLDLSSELVVLDWVYDPTLDHAAGLLRAAAASGERASLERFCFRTAMQVLERVGYGPLTRPTLLRIGFRDICRDMDFHEGTSVRMVLAPDRIVRAHLDYDGNALVFRTGGGGDAALERELLASFPSGDLRRLLADSGVDRGAYQLRFPLPHTLDEVRAELSEIRAGLAGMISRIEPGRSRALESLVSTFGQRQTLARLHLREPGGRYQRVARPVGAHTVH
jgi:hypothetical protein